MAVMSPWSAFSPLDDWGNSPFDQNWPGQQVEMCHFKSGANAKERHVPKAMNSRRFSQEEFYTLASCRSFIPFGEPL